MTVKNIISFLLSRPHILAEVSCLKEEFFRAPQPDAANVKSLDIAMHVIGEL